MASAGIVGRTPANRPKLDSSPQTAVTIFGCTPYFAPTWCSSSRCFSYICCAVRSDRAGQAPLEIGGEVERELRLRAIALEDLRDRLKIGEGSVDDFRLDAAGERFGAELRQPGIERLRRDWRDRLLTGDGSNQQHGYDRDRAGTNHSPRLYRRFRAGLRHFFATPLASAATTAVSSDGLIGLARCAW